MTSQHGRAALFLSWSHSWLATPLRAQAFSRDSMNDKMKYFNWRINVVVNADGKIQAAEIAAIMAPTEFVEHVPTSLQQNI